jgi:hypothetical protein
MYTNNPTPDLYRIAELRRREDVLIASERNRHRLLGETIGPLDHLRNRIGRALITVGNKLIAQASSNVETQEPATV